MKKLLPIISNKYFIAPALMLVWMSFFDDVNFFSQRNRLQQVKELDKKKEYYIQEIEQANLELKAIQQSNDAVEKFARERYLMKKQGEDLFIIVQQ